MPGPLPPFGVPEPPEYPVVFVSAPDADPPGPAVVPPGWPPPPPEPPIAIDVPPDDPVEALPSPPLHLDSENPPPPSSHRIKGGILTRSV